MGLYRRQVLPRLTDLACGAAMISTARRRVVPLASGRVLEVGMGSCLNLPYFDPARVREVVGVDPDAGMAALARSRLRAANPRARLVRASAQELPFEDNSFDTVLSTFSFCSIPDPAAALAEVRRVLRPGGEFLFCEHCAAPQPSVRRVQFWLTPLWRHVAGGCHLDRDFPAMIRDGGFQADYLSADYMGFPRWLTYGVAGRARVGHRVGGGL